MYWAASATRTQVLATLSCLCMAVAGCVGDEPPLPGASPDAGSDAAVATKTDSGVPDATVDEGAPEGGDAGDDASTPDAGPDSAPDADAMAPGCSGTDLLCGTACVPDDPRNCGACGHDCTNLSNVSGAVTCGSGVCTFAPSACKSGFAHCTGSPDLGCETSITTAGHCGSCGSACGAGTPLCSGSGSTYSCVSGCAAGAPTLCGGTTCVNTTSDAQNCNGCGAACTTSVAHAQATCSSSQCGYACTASYPNPCNQGCVNFSNDSGNCGSCGHACAAPPNGTATCTGSNCAISCNGGYLKCGAACVDGTLNGNCGGCGNTCPISCTSSQCIKAIAIAAGANHTCALLSDHTVECWGSNNEGQLGYATSQTCNSAPCSMSPRPVPGLSGVAAIEASENTTCALLTGGTVKCWGDNTFGQLGVAPSGSCSQSSPCFSMSLSTIPLTGSAVAVASGYESACAIISGGTVECWGNNAVGQLGDGTFTTSAQPRLVSNVTNAIAIAVGELHACALLSDHTAVCWGDNSGDMLGSGQVMCLPSGEYCSNVPVPVGGLSAATAVASTGIATCALVGINVECWGYLQTGLGDQAATSPSAAPIKAASVTTATGVAVGDVAVCALLSGGTAACWGSEPLGDGMNDSSSTAVPVMNLTGATALAVGYRHACALLSTGAVSCWSDNNNGELGNGTTTPSLLPTPVLW